MPFFVFCPVLSNFIIYSLRLGVYYRATGTRFYNAVRVKKHVSRFKLARKIDMCDYTI